MAELLDYIFKVHEKEPEKEPENKKQKQDLEEELKELEELLEELSPMRDPLPIGEDPYVDSDEENEFYLCGRTKEEADKLWSQYCQQIHDSEGFDFDPAVYPGGSPVAMYLPCPDFKEDSVTYERVKVMARGALKDFRDDYGNQYELVDVVNLVKTTTLLYYITFTARQCRGPSDKADAADVVKTMQTICGNRFSTYCVGKCRIKPTKPTN